MIVLAVRVAFVSVIIVSSTLWCCSMGIGRRLGGHYLDAIGQAYIP